MRGYSFEKNHVFWTTIREQKLTSNQSRDFSKYQLISSGKSVTAVDATVASFEGL